LVLLLSKQRCSLRIFSSMSHSSASAKGWEPPSIEELATQLPQYQIEVLLGRGGMGAVYKGRQTSLDRPVAIKILPLEMGEHDASYAQRFKNEARAMAKLNHPGIVAVYDFGETANGLLYFVMEFIEGTDVAKMIAQQGRLHSEHAMAITAHVCDALGYAHSLGILHRDIKPANIMVGYDGRVKVADFGLAKVTNAGESAMTRSGVVMGTLHYMAPESLILGADVDKRADIYAVGVMLYQMLTGKLPQGMFEKPSLQIKGLDPRYDKIVATALRDDRELRYASAEALRLDLDGILTQPVLKVEASAKEAPAALDTQARPLRPEGPPKPNNRPPARERTHTPERRSSSGWGLAAAALVIAAGAGVFMKLKNHEEAGTSTAATSVGNPASTPPQPPQASVPPDSATVPSLASKTENPAPATPPAMPADAQTVTPAAGVAASPMPAAAAPSPASGVPSGVQPVPPSPSAGLPAELATLDEQFRQLQQERVTKPFETGLEILNKNYSGGLGRAIAAEKSSKRFDEVTSLENEKRLADTGSKIPGADVAGTGQVLANLRLIYHKSLATLESERQKNLKDLVDPLIKRLEQLEADYTTQQKLADAQRVKEYRRNLPQISLQILDASTPANLRPAQKTPPVSPISATRNKPFVNTLGMKFVPVPKTKVLFCIWETRFRDYEPFAKENPADAERKPNGQFGLVFEQGADYPVGAVRWSSAKAFCEWLTKKERAAGQFPDDATYRLPKEAEVMKAVADELESQRPSKPNSNFADKSFYRMVSAGAAKRDFDDGFAGTAPVGSFKANRLGIYDLQGNVWEWCEEFFDQSAGGNRLLRGGSCTTEGYGRHGTADGVDGDIGFRIVIELP
jgi:serine/threonine protein kinase